MSNMEWSAVKNLLVIIHRDGGHHTQEVGLPQSIYDAAAICHEWKVMPERVAELEAEVATLRRRIDFFGVPEKMCILCGAAGPCGIGPPDADGNPDPICQYDKTYPELIAIAHAAEAEARELRAQLGNLPNLEKAFEIRGVHICDLEDELAALREDREQSDALRTELKSILFPGYVGPVSDRDIIVDVKQVYGYPIGEAAEKPAAA